MIHDWVVLKSGGLNYRDIKQIKDPLVFKYIWEKLLMLKLKAQGHLTRKIFKLVAGGGFLTIGTIN